MSEPILFGIPITTLILYFMVYSFAGWVMETLYCSVLARRFVARGFLLGPICPIYGVGALLMILFFSRFSDNLLLFYVIATVVMSAWEYFVGWALETTTHMKYWDYSHHKFNLNGHVSLFISLWWGILAYVAVFYVHPQVQGAVILVPQWLRYFLSGSLSTAVLLDAATTIGRLTLTTRMLTRLEALSNEVKLQMSLGKAELGERLESAVDTLQPELMQRLEGARENLDEALELLREKRSLLLEQAEHYSRRFRKRYSLTSQRFASELPDVRSLGERLKEHLLNEKKEEKAARQTSRGKK